MMIRPLRFASCPDHVDAPYLFGAALEDDYLQGFNLKKILKKVIPKPLQKLGKSIEKDFHKAKKWAQDHRKTLQIAAAVIGTAGVAAYAAGGWAALGAKAASGASSLWSGLAKVATSKGAAALGTTALTTGAKLYAAKAQAEAAAAQAIPPEAMGPGYVPSPGMIDSGGGAGGFLGPVGTPGEPMPGQPEIPEAEIEPITAEAPEGPNWLLIGAAALGLYLFLR